MTPDLTKTRTATPAPTLNTPDTPAATPGGRDAPARGGFASATVPRHLARGAVGFGALVASLALLPVAGPVSLLLAPVGLFALRGCPMCWAIGLAETVSAGRLRRSCTDGRCELTRAPS
ncbi:hypothetical protein ACFQ0M_45960 [Kitasatospora aburaviensis]|uniref:DUF2892 domain-containing protein n=1 Tax=Kitasatospora aburaviensis TaxID=67265 RepID=A0ABW1F482_9ACTN